MFWYSKLGGLFFLLLRVLRLAKTKYQRLQTLQKSGFQILEYTNINYIFSDPLSKGTFSHESWRQDFIYPPVYKSKQN